MGALGLGCFSEVGFVITRVEVVSVCKADAVDVASQFGSEETVFNNTDPFMGEVFLQHDLDPVSIFVTWIDWFGDRADFFSSGSVAIADPRSTDDDSDPVRPSMGQNIICRREGSDERF